MGVKAEIRLTTMPEIKNFDNDGLYQVKTSIRSEGAINNLLNKCLNEGALRTDVVYGTTMYWRDNGMKYEERSFFVTVMCRGRHLENVIETIAHEHVDINPYMDIKEVFVTEEIQKELKLQGKYIEKSMKVRAEALKEKATA